VSQRRGPGSSLPRLGLAGARLVRRCSGDFGGAVFAIAFFCCSLTPSLLPRSWPIQGVVSGIAAAAGYGAGTLIAQALRVILRGHLRPAARKIAGWVFAVAGPVTVGLFLHAGQEWQRDTRRLVGWPPPPWYQPIAILMLSWLVLALFIGLARQLHRCSRWTASKLGRVVPATVAKPLGAACVWLVCLVILPNVVYAGLIAAADIAYADINGNSRTRSVPPACSHVSGSSCSLVSWKSLGRFGRRFVSSTPTAVQLEAFSGRPATQPIRVYAGLASAGDLADEADLAVKELERTGAFHRKTLLVATSTGTGWVDPNAVAALEYMYNGDTAAVSMQYSFLASPISFLVDRDMATQASRLLFDRVHARWQRLPRAQRPRLLVFGESLGALGSQGTFESTDDIVRRTDGALWEGPPNASRLWTTFQAQREHGTPEVLPKAGGQTVRFGNTPNDLTLPSNSWPAPRVVYLQHASDPVVWWSPHLLLHKPDWLKQRRGPDVSPSVHWYPLVTFLQVTADLGWATHVPNGHGHNYHTDAAGAWARIAPSPGWTTADTAHLEQTLARLPRL
jgi:uncharacterized membrane protein